MNKITLESSNIDYIKYNPLDQNLFIYFKTRKHPDEHYVYSKLNKETFYEFITADSHGKYLNEHIKDRFTTQKCS